MNYPCARNCDEGAQCGLRETGELEVDLQNHGILDSGFLVPRSSHVVRRTLHVAYPAIHPTYGKLQPCPCPAFALPGTPSAVQIDSPPSISF